MVESLYFGSLASGYLVHARGESVTEANAETRADHVTLVFKA